VDCRLKQEKGKKLKNDPKSSILLGFYVQMCAGPENGAPGAIPTRDLPLRRRTLYAAELREPKLLQIVDFRLQIVISILDR
jgi:hypothetical protein